MLLSRATEHLQVTAIDQAGESAQRIKNLAFQTLPVIQKMDAPFGHTPT